MLINFYYDSEEDTDPIYSADWPVVPLKGDGVRIAGKNYVVLYRVFGARLEKCSAAITLKEDKK